MSTPEKPTGELSMAAAEEDEFYRMNPPDFSWIERILDEADQSESSKVSQLEKLGSSFFSNLPLENYAVSAGASTSSTPKSNNCGDDVPKNPLWTGNALESLQSLVLSDSKDEKSFPLEPTVSSLSKVKNSSTPTEQEESSFNLWYDSIWSPVGRRAESSFWPNQEVSIYARFSSQYIGTVYFLLEGGKDWTPPLSMKIQVLSPDQQEIPVHISKQNGPFVHGHICTFRGHLPGFYTVSANDVLLVNFIVKGSPLTIPVSRNYKPKSLMGLQSRVFFRQAVKGWGIAYSNVSNKIYVTDRDAHKIIIYHVNGSLDKCFGKQGDKPDELFRPTGVAVDNRLQRLIITDKDNHRVCVYTLDGAFIYTFGTKGFKNGEFNYPWGVASSPKDSSIAVVDSRNHRVQLFDCYGKYLRKFSVFETNPFEFKTEFDYPRGITFDTNGEDLYVTDFNVQAVFKFNNMLTQKMKLSKINFGRPQGIAIDHIGNILICDSRNNCIRVISREGDHISSISGHTLESFTCPQDITVTSTGEIIVVDLNSRVRVL